MEAERHATDPYGGTRARKTIIKFAHGDDSLPAYAKLSHWTDENNALSTLRLKHPTDADVGVSDPM